MKLLLFIVSSIAVLTVDCRVFLGGPDEGQQLKKTIGGAPELASPTRPERPEFPPHGHKRPYSFYEAHQLQEKTYRAPGRDSPEVQQQQLMKDLFNMTGIQWPDIKMEEGQSKSKLRNSKCRPSFECAISHGYCIDKRAPCNGRRVPGGCRSRRCDCCIRVCPAGFFILPGSSQCYIVFNATAHNWTQARELCEENNLVLAHPNYEDVKNLEMHLLDIIGPYNLIWLNAHGNGTSIVWQDDLVAISSSNPLWHPGQPVSVTEDWCLALWLSNYWLYPIPPFFGIECSSNSYFKDILCELP